MFNGIMQVQAEYTPRVQKYKQPTDDALGQSRNAAGRGRGAAAFQRPGVGVASPSECAPNQRRKARVNALEFA